MDFNLSEDQTLLKDMVSRLLRERYPFDMRRRLIAEPCGWSRYVWGLLAEQGLLAAPFSEAHSGLGGGGVETMIIGEELGAALSAEPYLSTVVMGGTALRLSGNSAAQKAHIPSIAAGKLIVACDVTGAEIVAKKIPGGWSLHGEVGPVMHGDSADRLVLLVRSGKGPLLLFVDAAAAGLAHRSFRTFDGLRAAGIQLEQVRVGDADVLAIGEAASLLADRIREHAIAYLAAEATGLMAAMLDMTVGHLKTRTQFGGPLSKFQALQHRAVEMLISLEQARSMAIFAAAMTEAADAGERRTALAAVKVNISLAARLIGQAAVQLHGGLGLTEEHRVGWGLRRLTMIDLAFGDADESAAQLAALGGFIRPTREQSHDRQH